MLGFTVFIARVLLSKIERLLSWIRIRLDPFNPTYGLVGVGFPNPLGDVGDLAPTDLGVTCRKGLFQMKITVALLILLVLLLPNAYPEEYTQWGLPEGAVARIGKGSIRTICFSPDITRVAVSSRIGVWFYDTATGQEITLFTGHPSWGSSMAFSPDGTTFASGSEDRVYLWDAFTGEHKQTLTGVSRTVTGEPGTVGGFVFSPDGTVLAGSGGGWDNHTIELWDMVQGEHKGTLECYTYDFILAFSPDGRTLACGESILGY